MDRVATGIKGFDELIEGGFPEGSNILYAGSPGTGKTIFALQYLYNGCKNNDDKALFVSFEQREDEIIDQAKQFKWNLQKLIKEKKLNIMSIPAKDIKANTAERICDFCAKNGISRLVIDSLSTLSINAPITFSSKDIAFMDSLGKSNAMSPPIMGDFLIKRFIYTFIDMLKNYPKLTTLLISEAAEDESSISRDTISEFLADGVIVVTFEKMGGMYPRSLLIRKMRRTKNNDDLHALEISNKGIIIHEIS